MVHRAQLPRSSLVALSENSTLSDDNTLSEGITVFLQSPAPQSSSCKCSLDHLNLLKSFFERKRSLTLGFASTVFVFLGLGFVLLRFTKALNSVSNLSAVHPSSLTRRGRANAVSRSSWSAPWAPFIMWKIELELVDWRFTDFPSVVMKYLIRGSYVPFAGSKPVARIISSRGKRLIKCGLVDPVT